MRDKATLVLLWLVCTVFFVLVGIKLDSDVLLLVGFPSVWFVMIVSSFD